jgi:hypothetical protein
MTDENRAGRFVARRREKRRLKRERTGDSPQKAAERRRPGDPDVKGAISRTGESASWVGSALGGF